MTSPICVIDCAIKNQAQEPFNRLVERTGRAFTYHIPSMRGMASLIKSPLAQAYLVFGSASSVHDNLIWQRELSEFVRDKLEKRIPVMGICFGHQLVAKSFGATVARVSQEASEERKNVFVGKREIQILEDSMGLKKGETYQIFKAHSEEVSEIPSELIHVATSKECWYEALKHRTLPYFGVQGHPEAYLDFVRDEFRPGLLTEKEVAAAIADGDTLMDHFINFSLSYSFKSGY